LVSKSGVDTSADVALSAQLTANPQGLALVSGASGLMALLPGMPMLPFLAIAGAAGYGAWRISQTARKAAAAPVIDPVVTEPQEEPIQTALAIDELKIELGFGLLGLINELDGRKLTDQIKALRRQLAGDLGVVLPPVRIIDNLALGSEEYVVRVKEMEAGRGRLKLHHLLTMDPAGGAVRLPGERVKEPAFGLPATWIEESLREEAMLNGYTVVDPAAVMTTHLTEIIKDNLGEFMSFATVQRLIKDLPKEHQKLVEDITPGQITQAGIQRVLQNLLREQVSIRDLPTILEAIAEAAQPGSDILQITEYVRARLARQLCHAYRGSDGALPVVTLSPAWEQEFQDALIGERDKTLALAPSKLHAFVADVRDGFDRAAQGGETPVLLTSPVIRPYVRSLIERFRPQTVVMSQNEVHPKARLKSYGSV
jgi:flagellar biosynthesis protein FlhA